MLASLSSNYDYYMGNQVGFNLKSAVADAGGTEAEYQVIGMLIERPLQGRIGESDIESFYDTYSGCALLSLFPPREQVLLCALFREEDKRTQEDIKARGYTLIASNKKPSDILRAHSKITGIPFSNYIMKALDEYKDNELAFLVGVGPISFMSRDDISLYEGMERILDLTGCHPDNIDDFMSIVVNNDRVRSAAMLSRALGYKESSVQDIAGVIETWTLNT